MRILHLLSQTELTGAEVYAQNLVEAQLQEGHQVFVISDRLHVPFSAPFQSLPLSASNLSRRLGNIQTLRQFIRSKKIEVIHCHSRGAVRHAFWARFRLPVALVTTLHGRQHFSWSKRLLHSYGEILIAVCENVKRAMEFDFHMSGSPIRVLRNPVSQLSFPKKITTSSSGPHLALIGRSSGPKGARIERIAETCFEEWLKDSPNLRISVIAPRPDRFSDSFHRHIESLNLKYSGRVRVLGHIPELRKELPQFDLVIGSGRIAIESLLAQVPTLALGEHSCHGLVRPENFAKALESNFGDIGAKEMEIPFEFSPVLETVKSFFRGDSAMSAEERADLQTRTQDEFCETKIQKNVLEAYRAAIFKRHVPRWIPALMYHKIPEAEIQSQHRIFVQKDRFEKHLRYFKLRKFETLTFRDLHAFWYGQKPYSQFPSKPLLLTFDDGYRDNLLHAEPLLRKHRARATIFLLGNHGITHNTWDASSEEPATELMTFEEKMKLDPAVWEIGSHGFEHLHLTQVPEWEAFDELKNSKIQLEKDFKQDIVCFAYPFGSVNEKLPALAEKAGYSFAVNTDQGGLHLADAPRSIFRVNVFPEDGIFQIWKKTSPRYRAYFQRKRGR